MWYSELKLTGDKVSTELQETKKTPFQTSICTDVPLSDPAASSSTLSHVQLTPQTYKLLTCHSSVNYTISSFYAILFSLDGHNCLSKPTQLFFEIGNTSTLYSPATPPQLVSPLLYHATTDTFVTIIVSPIFY